MVSYNEILANDYVLSKDGLKWIEFNKSINSLREKYPNILEDFKSYDGYAFPSSDYVTRFDDLKKKVKLLQIGNVNDSEWVITETQKFEYVPDKYIQSKKRYLLTNPCILISLTGGSETDNDITSYFDGSFSAFLNQRVSVLTMKEYSEDYFFYFYALTKSKYFKEQWLGKGGIQKNTVSSDRAKTYLPKISNQKVVRFISILTQAIIKKEQSIKERYINILSLIEQELLNNQKSNTFKFELPTINEIENTGRLDTNLYREHFKQIVFQIQNYTKGFQTIHELGFSLSRGQNLQVSNIGDSVYSKKKYKNFYTLMLPKFLSKYGTVDKVEYLGNPNSLKTLKKGDLIFGAEGFEKGRSIVIIEEQDRVITNIHGITIQQEEHNVNKAIFVKCCLDYLRSKGLIDLYAVGGNGGSLAQKYWDIIPFPNFPEPKQKEIALLYHNPESIYQTETFTLDNFLEQDNAFNETAGIYELDKTGKQLKEILNKAIDDIANDKDVEICFK
ncbi:restriction endonuclease subunit S domain-containing protein [Microcystis aeruginosa]|jgi:hypothetical protein|uniref:Type I restriction modification DNA specificity domain-containing protein n=1 Tax=Microcystis aeruginosa PCC 9717 TaxID=1160286 RepID=I4FQ36_MICAE|nr:hypothetical protein [Microcystis aeruginosa]CCH97761.1 hypothetical protein MICAB_3720003 [Microcystis aeruginosa PCC 9717]